MIFLVLLFFLFLIEDTTHGPIEVDKFSLKEDCIFNNQLDLIRSQWQQEENGDGLGAWMKLGASIDPKN